MIEEAKMCKGVDQTGSTNTSSCSDSLLHVPTVHSYPINHSVQSEVAQVSGASCHRAVANERFEEAGCG